MAIQKNIQYEKYNNSSQIFTKIDPRKRSF